MNKPELPVSCKRSILWSRQTFWFEKRTDWSTYCDGNDGSVCKRGHDDFLQDVLLQKNIISVRDPRWQKRSLKPKCDQQHEAVLSSHRLTSQTVAMSIDAVASSMMRMLLFLTKARAKQKSCRWPTLKFSPPSVTTASARRQSSAANRFCLLINAFKTDFRQGRLFEHLALQAALSPCSSAERSPAPPRVDRQCTSSPDPD